MLRKKLKFQNPSEHLIYKPKFSYESGGNAGQTVRMAHSPL